MVLNLEQMPEGPLTELLEYWTNLKIDDRVPTVSSFDMLAVPSLVSNLSVFAFVQDRIRVEFQGADCVDATGLDPTGHFIDELNLTEVMVDRCRECAASGVPYYVEDIEVTWSPKEYKSYNSLGVPLANPDGTPSKVVYLMLYK